MKKCVHEGKKIVLVGPGHKRLLTIDDQDAARERVGDYVEINGELNVQARTLHVGSPKLLEKGSAMCEAPKKRLKGTNAQKPSSMRRATVRCDSGRATKFPAFM